MQRIMRIGSFAVFGIGLLALSLIVPDFFETQAEDARAAEFSEMRATLQDTGIIDLNSGLDLIMNNPDQFHWMLFAALNTPAENGSNEVLWETWATDDDTFPESPKPSLCDVESPPAENCPIWPSADLVVDDRSGVTQLESAIASIPTPDRLGEVIYRNQSAFDYIVANDLWYLEGIAEKVDQEFDVGFPTDAIAVKSHWKQIEESDKARYHWAEDSDGTLWGLDGFHITTNQIPNWTWVTFEHVDNPGRCDFYGCQDNFGQDPAFIAPNTDAMYQVYSGDSLNQNVLDLFDAAGVPDPFQFYRLRGSQVDFTDTMGRPTILANSTMEYPGYTTSSCMTCHSRSAVNEHGQFLSILKAKTGTADPSTSPPVTLPSDYVMANGFASGTNAPINEGYVGIPDPLWFVTPNLFVGGPGGTPTLSKTSGQRVFMQMDFQWAFFNANNLAE